MKILITPTSLNPEKQPELFYKLNEFADELVMNDKGRPLNEEELIPLLKDCDGFIAGLDNISESVINSCNRLRVISRYGAGYDRVDIEAAKRKGIVVTNTPGVNAEAVGEHAFALILSLARRVPFLNNNTKSGQWVRSTGVELSGKTIGIVGLGAIGKVVARCSQSFNMKIIAYDPFINEKFCRENKIDALPLEEVLSKADVISLHLPLNNDTRHLINKETLKLMKDNAILINTSRGGIIDEEAAYEALVDKKLGGLGLDAFEEEPPKDSPLFTLDNVVVTPHTGAHTQEATNKMGQAAVTNLIDVLSGRECPFIVNK
ncbi:phosphoglycerate dehydrogenase [Alloiococcus sp. CFN-8]|uniref:phosphoglycerate dehydrogenase n=1 Tax=Alloiococcus sp. CFN-8 TaxID=3416081 RepID=UPI003CEC0C4D